MKKICYTLLVTLYILKVEALYIFLVIKFIIRLEDNMSFSTNTLCKQNLLQMVALADFNVDHIFCINSPDKKSN